MKDGVSVRKQGQSERIIMRQITLFLMVLFVGVGSAEAVLKTKSVEYHHGDVLLEGYLAYDDSFSGPRPGVLVVHEWRGLNDYTKHRAEQLAGLGYIAFAADMYGRGIYAKDHEEAGKLSGIYRNDRHLMRARAQAALDCIQSQPGVDGNKLAAIGYCFGGSTVLELARSGADLKGVVSFHGPLDTPNPNDAKNIRGKVLVLTGAADSFIPPKQIAAFEQEMKSAGVDYRVIQYPGAVHSFTVPDAGNDPSKGVAYNPEADKKSWDEMKQFLQKIFKAA